MSDRPEWFVPTRFGYGSGLPIAWQGWALLIGYAALMLLASFILPHSLAVFLATVFVITSLLMTIAAQTTRGGWRWRWGERD